LCVDNHVWNNILGLSFFRFHVITAECPTEGAITTTDLYSS
jgi:hypothetical protein